MDDDVWQSLRQAFQAQLASTTLPDEVRSVLKNKVASLNQLPQNLALRRLLNRFGLELGDAELGAWKHRNMAAHGEIPDDVIMVIFSSKLLRLLFYRLVTAITDCSDRYVDYYNLGFPVRSIAEAVPPRKGS